MFLFIYIMVITFCVLFPEYYKKGKTKSSKEKYGVLMHKMKDKQGGCVILTHVSYFSRRIILAVVTIYWNRSPLFQLFTLISVNMLAGIIQGHLRPAKSA